MNNMVNSSSIHHQQDHKTRTRKVQHLHRHTNSRLHHKEDITRYAGRTVNKVGVGEGSERGGGGMGLNWP